MREWGETSAEMFLKCLDTEAKWEKLFRKSTMLIRNGFKEFLEMVIRNPKVSFVLVSAGFANTIAAGLSTMIGRPVSSIPNLFIFSNYLAKTPPDSPRPFEFHNLVVIGEKNFVFFAFSHFSPTQSFLIQFLFRFSLTKLFRPEKTYCFLGIIQKTRK